MVIDFGEICNRRYVIRKSVKPIYNGKEVYMLYLDVTDTKFIKKMTDIQEISNFIDKYGMESTCEEYSIKPSYIGKGINVYGGSTITPDRIFIGWDTAHDNTIDVIKTLDDVYALLDELEVRVRMSDLNKCIETGSIGLYEMEDGSIGMCNKEESDAK